MHVRRTSREPETVAGTRLCGRAHRVEPQLVTELPHPGLVHATVIAPAGTPQTGFARVTRQHPAPVHHPRGGHVDRTIAGFHRDDRGDWVAELDCGHDQHVHHRPPFELRAWVLSDAEREKHIGSSRDCPLCDRNVLPRRIAASRPGPVWDGASMPSALRRAHRLRDGLWGRIAVEAGALRYGSGHPPVDVSLGSGETWAIPPGVDHAVEPLGDVRFRIDFFDVVDRAAAETGGESACFAHRVCTECGAVLDSGEHRAGCAQRPG
jgi:tellurite resistance-related uncharacterized protein